MMLMDLILVDPATLAKERALEALPFVLGAAVVVIAAVLIIAAIRKNKK